MLPRRTLAAALFAALVAVPLILVAAPVGAAEPGSGSRRLLTLDDYDRLRVVDDPQTSPDGEWVVYTVKAPETKSDRYNRDLWMARWDGSQAVQLTFSRRSEHTPRWSPDGERLAFLSARPAGEPAADDEDEEDQLWVMSRAGGEAERVTDFKGGVTDFAWAPDGRRLALIVSDPDPDEPDPKEKDQPQTPKPIVIDRYQFKLDETGYLKRLRDHLHLFDLQTRKGDLLTPGDHDEALPSWSPDGRSIAFVSKRGPDPDRHDNWDIFAIEARPGAEARQLTTYEGPDGDPSWSTPPAWSPDGRTIAFLQGGPLKLIYYAVHHLAVVPAAGGEVRRLLPDLDRNCERPAWSADGRSILFTLEDDRAVQLARIPAAGGKIERLLSGPRVVGAFSPGPKGKIAVLMSDGRTPAEVYALEGAKTRPLTRHNESWLAEVKLGEVRGIEFKSKDGTDVHGLMVMPPDAQAGRRHPAILDIHGGPVAQFQYEFDFDQQFFASRGYVVLAANPRGSSGRGEAFSTAIYADWGNKDTQDVLAAVDHAVSLGAVDPERLGVGGWSYGGILTNYTIAQDRRFKAAVSGASISNVLAGYGTDQYIREYEAELGKPWENTDLWTRLSHPFLRADRIVTPTLFMCGESDFNVPLLNSEQMYQALKSRGLETQLVIYPGQYHGLRRPTYLRDRLERYLGWFNRHILGEPARVSAAAGR
jgi:dipeptidyl aminopeptidase/acylaminoacyl peptidase